MQGYGEKGPCALLEECRLVQTLWKTLWRILNTLKIELPHDSAISLLGIYLKKIKTLNGKYIYTPVFIGALFIAAKIQKQVQLLKKKRNLAICDNMDSPQGHYAN